MTVLTPKPGFDWNMVSWGGPDETPTDSCSYCDDDIPEYCEPLMMWNRSGWAAQFCDHCATTWFGLHTSDRGECS